MGSLKKGAEQAVKTCVKVKKGEKVLIVADRGSIEIAGAIGEVVKEVKGNVKLEILEDYGKRPIKKLPSQIDKHAKWADVIFYMASSEPGEKNSLRGPLIAYVKKGKREAHMPDINEVIMKTGMCTDYDAVKKVSMGIFNIVKKAKEIRVKTKAGTDFVAWFNPKYKWLPIYGDLSKKGQWTNLPDGEVFTCVDSCEGRLVVDGVLGDYFGKYGSVKKTPVIVDIEKGRIVSLTCENKKIQRELRAYIKQDKNADRIGEFAIGTNIGLKKLVGEMLQDEKFPGIHIAVGSGYPDMTGAKWDSKAHCDMVLLKCNIFVDDKRIMKNGKFDSKVLNMNKKRKII